MQTFTFPAGAWITLVVFGVSIWKVSEAGKARKTYCLPVQQAWYGV
jgi:hypothetical protein